MPDFKGNYTLVIQPKDLKVPFNFIFSNCTAQTSNDGSLPYGLTINAIEAKAHKEVGTDVTSEMISSSAFGGLIVNVKLKYPATSGPGRYHLTIKLTLSDTSEIEFDFNRIVAMDK